MRRRRILRRLAVGLALLFVLPVVGGWQYMSSGETVVELHKVKKGSFDWRPGKPFFMLAIGSDERAGVTGRRGDALHIIGVNPKERKGTIINLPRDSWVDIPGHGAGRINEAFWYGGAQLQADTVSRLTGVPLSLVAVTTFDGLIHMVDEMGGIDVDVPMAMNDPNSGAVFNQGPMRMGGGQALAFSRNRHIPDGDIRRSTHQAHLLLAALANVRAQGTSPVATLRYMAVTMRHTSLEGIATLDLYRLSRLALSFDPANIRNVTMPSRIGQMGPMSVVFVGGGASELFADFRDDAILQSH